MKIGWARVGSVYRRLERLFIDGLESIGWKVSLLGNFVEDLRRWMVEAGLESLRYGRFGEVWGLEGQTRNVLMVGKFGNGAWDWKRKNLEAIAGRLVERRWCYMV